ncbi:MAG: glycosyltransferase family 4 protein, partial [Anaerolineales bacterium]|nr:glycosyltransferase family 4 protein [Anaerolineales bacterium]
MAKKIAFIRVFKNVPIAYSVERMLRETFPEYEVDVFDLTTLIKQRPSLVALNTAQTILTYGSDLVRRLKRPGGAFLATPYMFQNVKKIMHTVLENAQDDYLFSFQLQSLFDTSTGLMPHFVYTDHTHLANLTYPHYDQRRMYSAKWIELERTIYENADMVFTRSTNIKQSLIEQYEIDHGRVQCVYVGVNTQDNHTPQTTARYTPKRILFVGIDWERKGGPDLIAAFRQVLQTHPDAHLTIVGATPELGDLPNCEVIGKIPIE